VRDGRVEPRDELLRIGGAELPERELDVVVVPRHLERA
jgi:hypothetical protein